MGFGKEFLNAGDREWGGKMQDDHVDAVKWCIENGYADSERIAIKGFSYGGYAALCGATFTPDFSNVQSLYVDPVILLRI